MIIFTFHVELTLNIALSQSITIIVYVYQGTQSAKKL